MSTLNRATSSMMSEKTPTNSDTKHLVNKARSTISAASRLLRRKIPQSGHLMTSKRFWMQSIPNTDVDVIITFPHDAKETTVLWYKTKIERIPGIILRTKTIVTSANKSANCYAFHLSATYKGYLQGLEQLQVPKPIKDEYGGGTKEFTLNEGSAFKGIEKGSEFLSSQERQSVIYQLLNSIRAEKGEDSPTEKLKFREGEAILPRSLSAKVISQIFPIHDQDALKKLQNDWVKQVTKRQPIGDICEYFGVKIALYFAWLGHYTTALSIPALVGVVMWVFFYGRGEFVEDVGQVTFAFFNVIWATMYLESWKRRSAELAYQWGTADQRPELLAEPRPLFKGEEKTSDITGKPELFYPDWKRHTFRYFVTIPVISFCLLIVLASVVLILELQQWWDVVIKSNDYPSFLSFIPKVLLAVIIPVLDTGYNEIAVWLNDMENYKLEEHYEDHLVTKQILFQFVNSFLALFYTAFYLQDIDKLKELLAALLITRQVMGNIKESLIPYVKKNIKMAQLSYDRYGALSPTEPGTEPRFSNITSVAAETVDSKKDKAETLQKTQSARSFSQVEIESSAPDYEGTFDDYLEMFIQFGYVILFSSAYPLAGLCALVNNLIEIRGDAFKLCLVHKRPFGQRVNSIGTWQTAMELMGVVGIIVNCALIGQSGIIHRMFPNITGTQTIILIIVLEHMMLALKMGISYAIPDTPAWVEKEMAKIEYRRRELEKASQSQSNPMSASNSMDTEERASQTPSVTTGISATENSEEPATETISCSVSSRWNLSMRELESKVKTGSSEEMMDCDEILVAIKDRKPNQSRQVVAIVQKPVEPPDKGSKSSSSPINDSYSLDRLDAEKFRAEILSNSHSDIFRQVSNTSSASGGGSNSSGGIVASRKPTSNSRQTILESLESISSVETMTTSSAADAPPVKRSDEATAASSERKKNLYKRMASDTDLWLTANSKSQDNNNQGSRFQTFLESTKEDSVESDDVPHKPAEWRNEGGIIVNNVQMPEAPLPRRHGGSLRLGPRGGRGGPTPSDKRVLVQEEFDKRLKAKRAMFGSKRSLSLASFKLPAPRKISLIPSKASDVKPDPDQKYLVANQAKGELDSLTLESVININDVSRKPISPRRKV